MMLTPKLSFDSLFEIPFLLNLHFFGEFLAFDSLFEIRGENLDMEQVALLKPFDSLFEIPESDRGNQDEYSQTWAFDSLFEIQDH